MPAAAKAKTSRKAAEIEPKVAAKSGSKKQKVVEEVVASEEEDGDDDDEEEEDDSDEEDASDDDEEEEEVAAAVEEPEEEEAEEEAEGAFKDETLECKDCGNEFVFTSGEQEFYQQKVWTHHACGRFQKMSTNYSNTNLTAYSESVRILKFTFSC